MKTELFKTPCITSDPRTQQSLCAIIFDYGGVLTHLPTEEDWARMASLAGTDLPKMLEAYWLHRYPYEICRYDSAKYWGLVGHDCGVQLSGDAVRKLVAQDNVQWGRPNPDAIALSRQLRTSGMRTALLSNMQPDMLAFVRKEHHWLNEFEVRIFSCEVAEAKPQPAIFQLAAQRLNVPPEVCLFVDDREANVAGAREVGMQAVHFESAKALLTLKNLLSQLGTKLP